MGKTLTDKSPRKTEVPADSGTSSHGWRTVLFNDEWHTFQDVALQLVKATRCTYERGLGLANVVHHTGSAIVYQGPKERCEAVAAVLEDIQLKTQVCQ
jgi:ATP-dependent Clp protease adapter protein ClpS